jgi:hypothetical protein
MRVVVIVKADKGSEAGMMRSWHRSLSRWMRQSVAAISEQPPVCWAG